MFLKFVTILLFAILIQFFSSSAHAWCRSKVTDGPASLDCVEDEDALPLFWSRSCLSYAFNQDFFDILGKALSERDIRKIFYDSFNTWTGISCPDGGSPGFYFEQLRAVTEEDIPRYEIGEVNQSVILARTQTEWEKLGYAKDAYALTFVWHYSDTGEILDADMEINSRDGVYLDCETNICFRSNMFDLQNTVTHEVGHYLGLAHSEVSESTMYKDATPGETEKRSLHEDDIEGLCAAYPPGKLPGNNCLGTRGACSCPSPPIFEITTTGCGCRMEPARKESNSLLTLSICCLFLWWIRRFYKDPSNSSATSFLQARQRCAPLKSGSPQSEQ